MSIFKKYTYIVLSLWLASSSSIAGMMNQCQPQGVTTLCDLPLWQIGAHGLYAEVSSNRFQANAYSNDLAKNQNFMTASNAAWAWGFEIEAQYQYDLSNELTLNWYHFRTQLNEQLSNPVSFSNWIATNPISTQAIVYDSVEIENAQSVVNPSWDQVNVSMTKTIQAGISDSIGFYSGVNFSHIAFSSKRYIEALLTERNQSSSSMNQLHNLSASYNGFGSRTGLIALHDFQNHFNVYADAAISVLAGSAKSSHQVYDVLAGSSFDGFYGSRQMRVAAEFDGRLGAKYNYQLAEGRLSADISWLWANYFNVLTCHADDFGIQGLYFGLKWAGEQL